MSESRTKDGFIIRGAEMTRLETFVDAAFAFSVTLLVIGGGDTIPSSFDEFMLAVQRVPAFALCFGTIAYFWYAHNTWSRRYGLDDGRSTFLSLVLIFVVLVFVYPLKAIYSGAFLFLPGVTLESAFTYESADDFRAVLIIFGLGYSSLSSVIALLNAHALSLADDLDLSPLERLDTVTTLQFWVASTLIPLGSVVVAVFTHGVWLAAAGVFYVVFGIVMPVIKFRRNRKRRELLA